MSPAAGLIFHNANIITMDEARPRASAIAVAGSRILAVGSGEDMVGCRRSSTKIINCGGRTILPGFNDAHCHPLALAASLLSVDCGPANVRSIEDLQEALRRRASRTPPGNWIRAHGYNEFYLAEKRHPDRHDLDEASPDHPVKLVHRSGHACVLNTRAMALLGLSVETEEPPGAMMERDLETGEPNGVLFEMNAFLDGLIPPVSEDELEQGMCLAGSRLLECGITSIQDASWNNSEGRWRLLRRFKDRGCLLPRLSMMIGPDAMPSLPSLDETAMPHQLRPGAVKIVVQNTTGSLSPPQDELNRVVRETHEAGFQIAFHADEASSLEAILEALGFIPPKAVASRRHRIEHCSVCPPRLLARLKDSGAMVVTQALFIYYSGERYLATVPSPDLESLYVIGSLRGAGIRVATGSDAPVVPFEPLIGIYAAVTRKAASGQVLLPHESISAMEALRSGTLEGAYASFEDGTKGSVSPGKLADLVILDGDPTAMPAERIKDIKVTATILDGRVAWEQTD